MSNQELPPQPPPPAFDQIVKGNVSIKKLKKKYMYRITFSKIGKFLVYQVWDKDNFNNQNSSRSVFRVSAKNWVNDFIKQNKNLKKEGKELFTPTTIIETVDQEQYACVIHKAYFNSRDRVVFTISTKEIQLSNNCSKKLIKIPSGKFINMRFDIDAPQNGIGLVYNKSNCGEPYHRIYAGGGAEGWSGSVCGDWTGQADMNSVIWNYKGPNKEDPGKHNWIWCEIARAINPEVYSCP